jgi:regulator of nucleoside diphosphate kinase
MLLCEIARATVVQPDSLRPNIVGVDCEVEVRDNIRKTTGHLRIVYPGDQDATGHKISVPTPAGAALIGLTEGASIEWCTFASDRRSLTILRISHRPLKKGPLARERA